MLINRRKAFKGNFGIEKESLRIDTEGKLSLTDHTRSFGENNPFIIRDFSESQIEMITPPCHSIEESLNFLRNIQNVVLTSIGDELLWPQSNPPILPDDELIKVANYSDTSKKGYRDYLSVKYGKKKSVISGIHFNLSFDDEYVNELHGLHGNGDDVGFKNFLYLKIAKYFLKYRWLFIKLTAAGPVFHASFTDKCVQLIGTDDDGNCIAEGMVSLRNSLCGYRNLDFLTYDYATIDKLHKSINDYISQGKLVSESEVYEAVRIKTDIDKNAQYLELRFIDLNPESEAGVNLEDLQFIHLMFVYFSTLDDFDFNETEQVIAELKTIVANDGSSLEDIKHSDLFDFEQEFDDLLSELHGFLKENDVDVYDYEKILEHTRSLFEPGKSYADSIVSGVKKSDYITYHLKKAETLKSHAMLYPFEFHGYPNLELSTKILLKSAIKRGIEMEVVDVEENFIILTDPRTGLSQYVKQATKTNLDGYGSVLAMENKHVTKYILNNNGIPVPEGFVFNSQTSARDSYDDVKHYSSIVVKPNNTNFGIGITILKNTHTEDEYLKALEFAFKHDNTILVEKFYTGDEYRFLVINGKVEGVLHRDAANVFGDGEMTIEELINKKNENPLRGTGYVTPLEIIKVDDIVRDFLDKQGFTLDSVPKKGIKVYLRENSNISTGGDSVDLTDELHPSYLKTAVNAVNAIGANISGVDMMIEDIYEKASDSNHTIIELNFNPAIHIHCYPYIGKNRDIGDRIIEALFNK